MKYVFHICLILFTLNVNAQLVEIEWQNTIGSVETDGANSIIQTSDGGYLIGGSSYSGIGTDKTEPLLGLQDCWIIKTDGTGVVEWERTFGGEQVDFVTSIVESATGGYLIGAFSNSDTSANKTETSPGGDYWLIKLDNVGNIEWQNSIGGNGDDYLTSISQTIDSGYILCGSSNSAISLDKTENVIGEYDFWIVKINAFGEITWQNTIGGDLSDQPQVIYQLYDNGFIVGGFSNSHIAGDKTEDLIGDDEDTYDYWVIRLDSIGNVIWQNTIGGTWDDNLLDIKSSSDAGFILAGYSNSPISGDKTESGCGLYDYWVVKIDSIGNILWQNAIGGENNDFLHKLIAMPNGNFMLAGNSNSNISCDKIEINIGDRDFWPVLIDSLGNIIWQQTIGGTEDDFLWAIALTDNGWPILAGDSESGITGDKTEPNYGLSTIADLWVVKFNNAGDIQWQNTIMGPYAELAGDIVQLPDGGYAIGSTSYSSVGCDKTEDNVGASDYWIIKLDTIGNIVWQNTIGGNQPDELEAMVSTSDGGLFLSGSSWSPISGDKTETVIGGLGSPDYWVIKLNASGTIEWQNTIGGDYDDYLATAAPTPDGGFIIGGSSTSDISDDKSENHIGGLGGDYWVVKLNNVGAIEWDNTIGGEDIESLSDIAVTADGGYVLAGSSSSDIGYDKAENAFGSRDYWIIKLNATGEILWQKTIGGNSADFLYSVEQTYDNGFILGGISNSDISGVKTENSMGDYDYWVIKTDSIGNIEWQNTIGGDYDDYFDEIIPMPIDSTYLVTGYSKSGISGDKTDSVGSADYWILKLDSIGKIIWEQTYGGTKTEYLSGGSSITSDNGFIVNGASNSGISGDKTETVCGDPTTYDIWIVQLNCINQTYYADMDGDGYGNLLTTQLACYQPTGYVLDSTDCDDLNALIYPGAIEVINGLDDNCNAIVDEQNIVVNQSENEDYFILSPNPNNGTFTLKFNTNIQSSILIQVLDIHGKIIYENTYINSGSHAIVEVITGDLSDGIYILKAKGNNFIAEQKFIFQH